MKPRKLAAAGGAGDIVGERYFFLVFFLVYLGRCALNLSIEPQCHFLANLLGTTYTNIDLCGIQHCML